MLFTSYSFVGFIFVLFLLYYVVPKKGQWVLLLVASYLFYFLANPWYLLYILSTTVTVYLAACKLSDLAEKQGTYLKQNKGNLSKEEKKQYKAFMKHKQWVWLLICLFFNIGILFSTLA